MTKTVTAAALDAAFAYIASRADLLTLCAGAPATYIEATTPPSGGGRMLASTALTEGLGGGDFTTAPGKVSGLRLVVAAQLQVVAAEAGTADHVALVDQNGATVMVLTELTEAIGLAAGQIVALKSFSGEVTAPA